MTSYLNKLIIYILITQIAMLSAENNINSFEENSVNFAVNLFLNLENEFEDNIIFSPLSIQICMALLRNGATGQTANEIAKGLHFESFDSQYISDSFKKILDVFDNNKLVRIANKIYLKEGYKIDKNFMEIATKQFYSDIEVIDFNQHTKSVNTINDWIATKTNNKIKEVISPDDLNEDTRLILLNAIYFKGEWMKKFNVNRTKEDNFYLNENNTVKVLMMKNKEKFRYGKLDDIDASALEMPYKDSNLSMLILLPHKKSNLSHLKNKLKTKSLENIISHMRKSDVLVKIPKFRSEYSIDLQEPLKKLGMKKMFTIQAEFDNVLESSEELQVSKAIHKAFIEVNEEGVEAGATTAGIVRMKRSLDMVESEEFIVDRPFVYAITSTIFSPYKPVLLFLGSVNKLKDVASQATHDEL